MARVDTGNKLFDICFSNCVIQLVVYVDCKSPDYTDLSSPIIPLLYGVTCWSPLLEGHTTDMVRHRRLLLPLCCTPPGPSQAILATHDSMISSSLLTRSFTCSILHIATINHFTDYAFQMIYSCECRPYAG